MAIQSLFNIPLKMFTMQFKLTGLMNEEPGKCDPFSREKMWANPKLTQVFVFVNMVIK